MSGSTVIDVDKVPVVDRGAGIKTQPLIGHSALSGANMYSAMTWFPPGEGAPLHYHQCDEHITMMEGRGIVEIDGVMTQIKAHDTMYIEAGSHHRFYNTGNEPMCILWIHNSSNATRTLVETGETNTHRPGTDRLA